MGKYYKNLCSKLKKDGYKYNKYYNRAEIYSHDGKLMICITIFQNKFNTLFMYQLDYNTIRQKNKSKMLKKKLNNKIQKNTKFFRYFTNGYINYYDLQEIREMIRELMDIYNSVRYSSDSHLGHL